MSEDFRQPGVFCVTGQTGVGKSHYNDLWAQQYVLDNPKTRKQGLKFLFVDAKEEPLYSKYQILTPENLHKQPQKSIMRMVFRHGNGRRFSLEEKKKLAYFLLNNYKDGGLLFEDMSTYLLNTKGEDIVGPLTTARHNHVDIIFSMQNMSRVTPEIWQNLTGYRFHKQTTSVDSQYDDIEDFVLFKISEIIVNEQFRKATMLRNLPATDKRKLTEMQYKKLASYHIWIDIRTQTIKGCSEEGFRKAVVKMILENPRAISAYCRQNSLNYKNSAGYNQAVKELLISYLPHYKPMS